MKKLPLILSSLFLALFTNLGKAQSGACDTLFLVAGDTILISVDHNFFRNKLLYNYCIEKGNRTSVAKKEVLRIGESFLLTKARKPKRNLSSKLVFNTKKRISGKLYGVTDRSILILNKERQLMEYPIDDLNYARFYKKEVKTLIVISGAIVGMITGVGIASAFEEEGESPWGAIYTGTVLGTIGGIIVGNFIGSLGVKVDINGNRDTFKYQINKVRF